MAKITVLIPYKRACTHTYHILNTYTYQAHTHISHIHIHKKKENLEGVVVIAKKLASGLDRLMDTK